MRGGTRASESEVSAMRNFGDSTNAEDLICQEECQWCGDDAKHGRTSDSVPWTRRGDALCSECKGMRDATSTTACCRAAQAQGRK